MIIQNLTHATGLETILFSRSNQTIEKENGIFKYLDFEQNIVTQIIESLYQHQIQTVIIEGGRQTLQTFIDANLWDEARIFVGNMTLKTGTEAPKLGRSQFKKQAIGTDELLVSRNYD